MNYSSIYEAGSLGYQVIKKQCNECDFKGFHAHGRQIYSNSDAELM